MASPPATPKTVAVPGCVAEASRPPQPARSDSTAARSAARENLVVAGRAVGIREPQFLSMSIRDPRRGQDSNLQAAVSSASKPHGSKTGHRPSCTTARVPASTGAVLAQEGRPTPSSISRPEGRRRRRSAIAPHSAVRTSSAAGANSAIQPSPSRKTLTSSVRRTTSTSESSLAESSAQEPTIAMATTSSRSAAHFSRRPMNALTSSLRPCDTTLGR
jgi:hypothetical protein